MEPLAPPTRPHRTPGAGKAVWRAVGFLRSYRGSAAGALLALLAVSAANLAAPQLVRFAIDAGIARRSWAAVLGATGGLVGIALVRGLFNFVQGYLAERA